MQKLQGRANHTVLIADDELHIQDVIQRFLNRHEFESMTASDGLEALSKARTQKPSVILLDVQMPGLDGFTVCRKLRENPDTRLIPILMLTAKSDSEDKVAGLTMGADDYLTKPFDLAELRARIETLLRRNQRMISVNPLTQLPGSPSVQEEIERRIQSGKEFGAAYIDIDHFKAYNDAYGYQQGDEVIKWTSKIIQETIHQVCPHSNQGDEPGAFLGHIGGDDFILVSDLTSIQALCGSIADRFDQNKKVWYRWLHNILGSVKTKDRQGNPCTFPLMSLSIAVSTNEKRKITHYAQVAQVLSELKKFAKNRAYKSKSYVALDRRTS